MFERRLIETVGRRIDHDPAVRQADDTIGVGARKMHLMEAADDTDAICAGDPLQEVEDAAAGVRVEARGTDHYEFRDGKVIKKDSYWKIVEK